MERMPRGEIGSSVSLDLSGLVGAGVLWGGEQALQVWIDDGVNPPVSRYFAL